MSLSRLLVHVGLVSAVLLGLASLVIIGRGKLRRLRDRLRPRIWRVLPYLVLLGSVLVANKYLRTLSQDISWTVGVEITSAIYAAEGGFVPWIQTFTSPPLTAFFSATYIYGYIFVLIFPLLVYLSLEDLRPFRRTCLAYSYNYVLGLCLYVLFIAYGPRNLLPDLVEPLMYTSWPESQVLTSQINTNTNVFPSLHASLSATVAYLAFKTRGIYPRWFYLSSFLAGAIMLSTLYLGIHWGIDVLAGTGLGVVSVAAAYRWDPVQWLRRRFGSPEARQGTPASTQPRDD